MRKTDVFGNVHQDGPRATRAGDIKRLTHRVRELFNVPNQEVVLDARSRDANGVAFLEGIFTNGVRRHLTTDDDHGNGVHIGGRDPGDRVCHAWATSHQAHTDFIRAARIGICSMHRSLLVSHQNMFDFFLLVDRVVDVEYCATGVAKQMFYAFFG